MCVGAVSVAILTCGVWGTTPVEHLLHKPGAYLLLLSFTGVAICGDDGLFLVLSSYFFILKKDIGKLRVFLKKQ